MVDDASVEQQIRGGAWEPGGTGVFTDPSGITEDELTALALAADPADPMDEDAVPLALYLGTLAQNGGLLPQWYMPTPTAPNGRGWRLPVVLVVVAAFVIIEALGLCSTFGQITVG